MESQDNGEVMLEMDRIWRPVFDKYDNDKTGTIKLSELKQFLEESNNLLSEDVPSEVLEKLLNSKKNKQDDSITYDEFLEMIHDTELGIQRPRLHRLIRYAAMAVVPKSQRKSVIRKYLEEYNCMPPPVFIISITIIEVCIFIYYCVILNEWSVNGPTPWKSNLIYDPCKRNEIWRFFTYIFIHVGLYHIIFNLLIQLILGIPLEMVHKWWRVGIVYITGVIAGSLASSITDPYAYLAGASGGVYALLAAHLASVVINWSEMEFNWVRLIALLIFIFNDIGVALYERYGKETKSKVSYSAHLAGAFVGFFIGVNTLKNLRTHRWEIIFGWIVLVIYFILMGFSILFNILNEDYFIDPKNPERCNRLDF